MKMKTLIAMLAVAALLAGCAVEGHDCMFMANSKRYGSAYAMTKVECDGKW